MRVQPSRTSSPRLSPTCDSASPMGMPRCKSAIRYVTPRPGRIWNRAPQSMQQHVPSVRLYAQNGVRHPPSSSRPGSTSPTAPARRAQQSCNRALILVLRMMKTRKIGGNRAWEWVPWVWAPNVTGLHPNVRRCDATCILCAEYAYLSLC